MKVQELVDELSQYDGELEVRLMEQPSWPFEYSIAGVIARAEMEDSTPHVFQPQPGTPRDEADCVECGQGWGDELHVSEDRAADERDCVFITEGSQLCYGSRRAWGGGY
jgi:hypothetical protein